MKSNVYIIYKIFEDWCEPTPVAVYSTFEKAIEAERTLNAGRTDKELEAGLLYYVNMKGVTLYD